MQPRSAPTYDVPARHPAVTRSDARADERRRMIEAVGAELPALSAMDDAPELRVFERALDVCRRLRDATTRTERDTAIALACAVADEAE